VVAKIFLATNAMSKFRFTWMDAFVIMAFVGRVIGFSANAPIAKVLEREAGTFFDTMLPYIVARLAMTERKDFVQLIQTLIIIAIPLASIGAYQSWTGHNPFSFMRKYDAFNPIEQPMFNRIGWYRGDVTFGVSIAFGLFFSMVVALSVGIWKLTTWKRETLLVCCAFMLLGA